VVDLVGARGCTRAFSLLLGVRESHRFVAGGRTGAPQESVCGADARRALWSGGL
jgi:hypothetical protein